MSELNLIKGYTPGLIGQLAELFGLAYVESHGFGKFFETRVARDICDHFETYDPDNSLTLSYFQDGELAASLTIDGSHANDDGAHLRWFIANPKFKGQGLGQKLLKKVIDFAHEKQFPSVYLWTLSGLEPAASMYRSIGFSCEERFMGDQWGSLVEEEKLRLTL